MYIKFHPYESCTIRLNFRLITFLMLGKLTSYLIIKM